MTSPSLCALLFLLFPSGLFAQNLIANGDFEAETADWSGGALSGVSPHRGQACLEVVDASSTISVDASTKLVALPGSAPYRFSFWARAEKEGQVVLVVLNQYRADGSWISRANIELPLEVGTAWKAQSVLVRSLHIETAQIQVSLRPVPWTETGELMGRAFFDDIVLTRAGEADALTGAWLQTANGPIWVSPVEQKVRPSDTLRADAPVVTSVHMEAARGEWEPAMVALRLDQADELIELSVTDLTSSSGSTISAAQIEVHEVAYVTVTSPTDFASYGGELPDPLPKLALPLTLQAGRQQPLWITLHVPNGTQPGTYRGVVELNFATAMPLRIPLEVIVWNFGLGRVRHLRTGYALSLAWIDRYHHLGGDSRRRREVFRAYLENFADHGVSPMNVVGDDQYTIRFENIGWPLATVVEDPATPGGTNRVMKVIDEDPAKAVAIESLDQLQVESGKTYVLSWRAQGDTPHDYLMALTQYDADGNWIPGRNIDVVRSSEMLWRTESIVIGPAELAPGVMNVRIFLYARPWTENGELLGTTLFDDISFRQQPSGKEQVVNGDFQTTAMEARAGLDFSRFDQAAAYALDTLGMSSFQAHLPLFAAGSFEAQQRPSLLDQPWGTPAYEAAYLNILGALEAHLAEKGWLQKAYVYWFDEPEPKDLPFVKQGMSLIRRGAPRLSRLLTEEYRSELGGDIDIWAPMLDLYRESWAAERQARGEQMWWYVCTGPKAPYPNNFIDHPAIEHRLRFWMAWKWNLQGDLFWLTNYWTNDEKFPPPSFQDPWTDPMSYSLSAAGAVGEWGNGDGRLLYPPRAWKDGKMRVEGPTPSLRWELIREGIDDYEYFWKLRDGAQRLTSLGGHDALVAQANRLLALPASLIESREQYSADPALFASYRRDVALALEAIEVALGPAPTVAGSDGSIGQG